MPDVKNNRGREINSRLRMPFVVAFGVMVGDRAGLIAVRSVWPGATLSSVPPCSCRSAPGAFRSR